MRLASFESRSLSACGRHDLRRRSNEHYGPFLHGTPGAAAVRLWRKATLRCHLDNPSDVDRRAVVPTPGTQRSGHAQIADPVQASATRLIWNPRYALEVSHDDYWPRRGWRVASGFSAAASFAP